MRIGVIGTGHVAAPMVRHLARAGHDITVSRRNEAVSAELAAELGVAVADPQGVLDAAEIVCLCLRPQVAEAVLAPLAFRAGQAIVSVMAAIPDATLATLSAPATRRVRAIPFPFLDKGGCPLPAFGDADLLATLFAPENPVIPVATEAAFDAHFAAASLVPAVLEMMAAGSGWLAGTTGDAASAERYVKTLITGYLAALPEGAGNMAAERDALVTPETLSLQMVAALRGIGLAETLDGTFTAIGDRLA